MLTEYLKKADTGAAAWSGVAPGVEACTFALRPPENGAPLRFPPILKPQHFETLFCRRGSLVLEQSPGRRIAAEAESVLLLSDAGALRSVWTDGPLEGVLVTADAKAARESLLALCGLLGGLRLDVGEVRRRMAEHSGCACLGGSAWTQSVFGALDELPEPEQGRYCVWKSVELLYLLCSRSRLLVPCVQASPVSQRMARRVRDMRAYMERHLNEKLTIQAVCGRFYLSPTSFKKIFRQLYGEPVHQWLQRRRMEEAAALLHGSDMTVLRIAQTVGYDGLSQFNAAFKRRFGCTPRQYRNMSEPVSSRPIPQDTEEGGRYNDERKKRP